LKGPGEASELAKPLIYPIFVLPSSLIAIAPIPLSMGQSTELCREKCLAGFLHASHSFFRHRSRFVLPNDGLLEAVGKNLVEENDVEK
jgi:hypothetical protein